MSKAKQAKLLKAHKLGWDEKQLKIAELLLEGKMEQQNIAKLVGVSNAYVTYIKWSLQSGQVPPPQSPPSQVKSDSVVENDMSEENGVGAVVVPQEEVAETPEEQPAPAAPQSGKKYQYPPHLLSSAKMKGNTPGVAAALKFITVPLVCPMTPVMLNARALAEIEWGWPKDMPWEDFFDTMLYLYCKACGYTIGGYIIDKQVEDKEEGKASPVTAPQKAGGNGNIDMDLLAIKVAEKLMIMGQTQVVEGG